MCGSYNARHEPRTKGAYLKNKPALNGVGLDAVVMDMMGFPPGTIKTQAKFMVMDVGKDKPGSLICGGVWTHLIDPKNAPKKEGHILSTDELWVADLIIIPHYKFNNPAVEDGWVGLRLDQKICSGWSDLEKWKRRLYP